ncbi:hypothetical protein KIH39_09025 [Telmatocola sphagniphila]|uniref:Uncharacterized protein n=1 Tax=Telmatocola sphagniphila TaxID=1123043 RepID=A0A8E6EWI7_9BACT|nr:hypothetical protein [Telmatocola sphagniphila]QVL34030.1 hypothetical protein KIH39_09025 [Telmatocola sphagniphila]
MLIPMTVPVSIPVLSLEARQQAFVTILPLLETKARFALRDLTIPYLKVQKDCQLHSLNFLL